MPGSLRSTRARLVSTYYDTPDHALARRGSSLRVRRHGRRFIQTLKSAGAPDAGALARGEWEDAVADDAPDPAAAQTGAQLSPDIARRLRPMFRTEVSRLTIPLNPAPATRIEAAIDRGRILNGERTAPAPISEVELELKSGEPSALYDVALELLHVAPLRLERRSKAERGYRLTEPEAGPARAVHAAALDLDPQLTAAVVLQRAGRACLDHLLRNEEAARGGDAEAIHQMRVAVRRLRAILWAFAPLLPKAGRRRAASELRWFADTLGEARNLDVFVAALLAPARAALPEAGAPLARLAAAAVRRRQAAARRVAAAIRSTRYTGALLALLRWFDGAKWRDGDPALQQSIAATAPLLLDRCRKKAARRAKGFARQSAKKRHHLRIALKRLRYTAELLSGLYQPSETRRFIHRLKRLQDDLGDANDVRAGHDIVATLTPHGRRPSDVARAGRHMLAWHGERIAENEPKLHRHLDALLEAAPFWRAAKS
jgi:inorganic triphosphatase YgiF